MPNDGGQLETKQDYHFTYSRPLGDDLAQGDVIRKDETINDTIRTIHPHYVKQDYTHFIILTQSCDIIRRENKACNAHYITLAAVRPLKLVIRREIQKYQQKDEFKKAANIASNNVRFKINQFLERLLNNNEPEYFYLHKDEELEFFESSVAFLRLSVALRTEHYDTIFNSRILSLTDIFKAKLGWLVGNMYSRVGTDEWVPRFANKDEFEKFINELLVGSCEWIDDKQLKEAKRLAGDEWKQWDMQKIQEFVKGVVIPSKKEKIIERVITILSELKILTGEDVDSKERDIKNTLGIDPTFSALAK
jgi:hypothetical protein